jgi:hypothetical protein
MTIRTVEIPENVWIFIVHFFLCKCKGEIGAFIENDPRLLIRFSIKIRIKIVVPTFILEGSKYIFRVVFTLLKLYTSKLQRHLSVANDMISQRFH